ncbi:MAG: sortase [Microgenomates group bacterium]
MSAKNSDLHDQLVLLYRRALLSGIDMAEVDEKISEFSDRQQAAEKFETLHDQERYQKSKSSLPTLIQIGSFSIPVLFIGIGLYLVGTAVVPIVTSYISSPSQLQAAQLMAPIPQEEVLDVTPLVITQENPENLSESSGQIEPQIIDEALDYTNLNNWFIDATLPELATAEEQEGEEYIVDIPKLKISNARVKVGGANLDESLIAYPGTALPGDAGAPVIFGHSVLRAYYNPNEKNPRRYNSIFSTIMTLKTGDEIFVTQDGVKYKYLVQEKTEVKPEDVYILKQNYSVKQLKLVTCTPEGTYLRRGVVTATLVPFSEN